MQHDKGQLIGLVYDVFLFLNPKFS